MLRQGNLNRATTLAFHPLLKCPAAQRRRLQKEEGRKEGEWRVKFKSGRYFGFKVNKFPLRGHP